MEKLWDRFHSHRFEISEQNPYGPPLINCLKSFREQTETSISELSQAVGISRQSYRLIEKGKTIPSLLTALKIAEYFDTNVPALFQLNPYTPVQIQPSDKVKQHHRVEAYWQKRQEQWKETES